MMKSSTKVGTISRVSTISIQYKEGGLEPAQSLQNLFNQFQARKFYPKTSNNETFTRSNQLRANDHEIMKVHQRSLDSEHSALYLVALTSSLNKSVDVSDAELEYFRLVNDDRNGKEGFDQVSSRRTPFANLGKDVDNPGAKNPLRGRIVGLILINGSLYFIYFCLLAQFKWQENYNTYLNKWEPTSSSAGPFNENTTWQGILQKNGALDANFMEAVDDYWQIFWAMWMHTGWLHITMNVLIQVQYFFMMEPDWGFIRLVLTYWISGVVGNCVSVCMTPCTLTCGSSGALYGILGASIVHQLEYWKAIPRPWINICFSILIVPISIMTSMKSGVDNWAHLGGFAIGCLVGLSLVSTLGFINRKDKGPWVPPSSKRQYAWRYFFETYSNSWIEWTVRLISIVILATLVTFISLKVAGERKTAYTPGAMTWSGFDTCCCAHFTEGFMCAPCAATVTTDGKKLTADEYMTECATNEGKERDDVDNYTCPNLYYSVRWQV